MLKQYKAIFFDWDGTAVLSRRAPVDEVIEPMKKLLQKGVKLAVISGTTLENIANGKLHEYFTPEERKNLFYGLGRGAYTYFCKDGGEPELLCHNIPGKMELLKIHDICYQVHRRLFEEYSFPTDIVFSRPNYCKIDLMVENNRGEALFFQETELEILESSLQKSGFMGGIQGLLRLVEEVGAEYGTKLSATTDAKYLEAGVTSKSDNVNALLNFLKERDGILPEEVSFWGDEFVGLADGIFGSDSYMITKISEAGDFFDVSEAGGIRPQGVQLVGGGVKSFLRFLMEQV